MPLPIGMEPVSPEEMDAAAAVVERAAQRAPWPLKLAIGPRLPIDAQEGANYACGAWIPAPACTVMLALTGRERPLPLVAWHEVHHAVHHLMPPEDRAAVRLHGNRVRTVLQGTQEDSAWWQSLAAGGEAEAESFARFRFGLRPWPGGVEPDEDACRAWMRLVP